MIGPRLISVLLGAALLTLAFALPAESRARKTVQVKDDFFDPTLLTIKEGTTVDFEWVDTMDEHNIIRQNGPGRYFESESSDQPGFTFTHKFKKRGTYHLVCQLHDEMEMDVKVKRRR